ncbi:TetR/AcrR family transcriptional regulator [Thalassotalea euphylliae]|uniref:TetR/AcrR family transcriptional regulator n=1 Tax=Thalassotalea euphylliae TaxID=1655234 RepID=UPI00364559EE
MKTTLTKTGKPRKVQQRRLEREKLIKDAAIELLKVTDIHELSLYDVAEKAEIPPSSLYHIYPSVDELLAGLTEQSGDIIYELMKSIAINGTFNSWRELLRLWFDAIQHHHNHCSYTSKLLLGVSGSHVLAETKAARFSSGRQRSFELLNDLFELPAMPEKVDVFNIARLIGNQIFSFSFRLEGEITDLHKEEAYLAVIGYLQNYFPRYMPRKVMPQEDEVAN